VRIIKPFFFIFGPFYNDDADGGHRQYRHFGQGKSPRAPPRTGLARSRDSGRHDQACNPPQAAPDDEVQTQGESNNLERHAGRGAALKELRGSSQTYA